MTIGRDDEGSRFSVTFHRKHPEITDEVRLELAAKYIDLYERITGETFTIPENPNSLERIEGNIASYKVTVPA